MRHHAITISYRRLRLEGFLSWPAPLFRAVGDQIQPYIHGRPEDLDARAATCEAAGRARYHHGHALLQGVDSDSEDAFPRSGGADEQACMGARRACLESCAA